jgi:hypothetical protein
VISAGVRPGQGFIMPMMGTWWALPWKTGWFQKDASLGLRLRTLPGPHERVDIAVAVFESPVGAKEVCSSEGDDEWRSVQDLQAETRHRA